MLRKEHLRLTALFCATLIVFCAVLISATGQAAMAQDFFEPTQNLNTTQDLEQLFTHTDEQALQQLQNDMIEASAFGARTDIDFTPFSQFNSTEQFNLNLEPGDFENGGQSASIQAVNFPDIEYDLDEVTHDLASADFSDTDQQQQGSARFRAPRRGRPNIRGSGVPPSVKRKIEKFEAGTTPTKQESAVLSTPAKDTVLRCTLADISVSKGSAVLVIDKDGELAVFNLHDKSYGDVKVAVANKTICLTPGKAVVVRRDNQKPVFLATKALRRAQQNEFSIYTADFSIAGLIKGAPPLRKVVLAGHHTHAIDDVLKTAVIIQIMRRSKEKRS